MIKLLRKYQLPNNFNIPLSLQMQGGTKIGLRYGTLHYKWDDRKFPNDRACSRDRYTRVSTDTRKY